MQPEHRPDETSDSRTSRINSRVLRWLFGTLVFLLMVILLWITPNLMMNDHAAPVTLSPIAPFEFRNELDVPVGGGHIQGVQRLGDDYVISGSSADYAYLALISQQDRAVTELRHLSPRPFKHAGGFQINGQWMAVGVEDNEARNVSKVFIYKFTDAPSLPQQPVATIERIGAYERATAGAVGIAEKGGDLWLVVGDWDSRHLDFYRCSGSCLEPELAFTINADDQDKSGWSDSDWESYQNLNLYFTNETLYLVGTTSLLYQSDVIDLFEVVEREVSDSARLVKKRRYLLERADDTAMRWGGGLFLDETSSLQVLVTEKHVGTHGVINRAQLPEPGIRGALEANYDASETK